MRCVLGSESEDVVVLGQDKLEVRRGESLKDDGIDESVEEELLSVCVVGQETDKGREVLI